MRNAPLLTGLLALLLSVGPAPAQEPVLTGVLAAIAPDARVSWDRGASQAGQETYEGLFVGQGPVRVRGDQVRVIPDGPIARIEADRVVLNLDGEDPFSIEVTGLSLTVPASALRALRDGPVPDLCFREAEGARLEARGVRILRDIPVPGARPVRAEARADLIRLTQEVRRTGSGCEVTLAGRADGAQEARSDKSGLRFEQLELTLTLPGNLDALTSAGAPDLTLALRFGGALRQVPGGASVAAIRDGSVDARISAIGAVPALTALLRTRGAPTTERAAAALSALTPARARVAAQVNGATLLVEALLPTGLISGLSRASLTSMIGDYGAELETGGGDATLRVRSDAVGIGRTGLDASLRLAPRREDAPGLGLGPRVDQLLPDIRLGRAELTHQDGGLLRAIELISGSPVSVLAAIFLNEGIEAVPEGWRPAARRAVTELARFFSLTPRGEGALLRLSTPQDLSVPETYRLLTLRPELADQLIVTEVTQAPPKGP